MNRRLFLASLPALAAASRFKAAEPQVFGFGHKPLGMEAWYPMPKRLGYMGIDRTIAGRMYELSTPYDDGLISKDRYLSLITPDA